MELHRSPSDSSHSQRNPKGLGIKEQITMNKTSRGLFISAKINELSNKYKISQILKFAF